jgi:hypothetical protein
MVKEAWWRGENVSGGMLCEGGVESGERWRTFGSGRVVFIQEAGLDRHPACPSVDPNIAYMLILDDGVVNERCTRPPN